MKSPSQKKESEAAHQAAIFEWAELNMHRYPCLRWLHAIPNGGSRGDTAKGRAIHGAAMKAQGVRRGVADIFLPVRVPPLSGLYIELKKPDQKPKREGSKGGISDEQREFGMFVISQSFRFKVCYGWREAVDEIEKYLQGR